MHMFDCTQVAALNYTVASVPAREYVFVLTDANARTGKRDESGGEADNKVLGASGRDKLNENGNLLLGLQKTISSLFRTLSFASQNLACPIRSKAPTAARDKHVWIIS